MFVERVIQDCDIKFELLHGSNRFVPGFDRHNFVSGSFHQ